jgi:hypothetical protein
MKNLINIKFLTILLSVFILISCNNTNITAEAVEYNNKIVYAQNRITEKMLQFSNALTENQIKELDTIHKNLIQVVKSSIEEIELMPAFEGDSSLKNTALELFYFYKKIIENEYSKLIAIHKKADEDYTQEDQDWINSMVEDVEKKEVIIDDKFAKVQEQFALKYNFTIKNNNLQDSINKIIE